jgi:alpha-L-fucosidase
MNKKWETNRGVGNSYGYNRFETQEHYMESKELIKMFIDIVSKNGNLLLNIGPKADGSIPELQKKVILGLGKWLEQNGEAIYGTRPWIKAEGKTYDNGDLRFTKTDHNLFVILLDKLKKEKVIIKSLLIDKDSEVRLLGYRNIIKWSQVGNDLRLEIPEDIFNSSAYSFKITPIPQGEN